MSMNDGRNRGPRRPQRRGPGHNPNSMRPPMPGASADVEVLSEADLAADGLVTFAALANLTATELMAAAKRFSVATTQQDELATVIQRILSAQAEERGQIWAEGILEIVDDGYGFIRRNGLLPSADDVIDRYAQVTGRDMSEFAWYRVLACYRLGLILEGTHARACAGLAPKDVGDMLHATTVALLERALELIG